VQNDAEADYTPLRSLISLCTPRPECTQWGSNRSCIPTGQDRQQCLSPAVVPRNHPAKKKYILTPLRDFEESYSGRIVKLTTRLRLELLLRMHEISLRALRGVVV
jgi:hypothetical protein